MAIERMPSIVFVAELEAALNRKDGYIMGATGQNPKNWKETSWWFTQYSGEQKKKALYWREHAARVWDCNGMSEGLYKDFSGVNIDTKARYNYAQWCDPKGTGMIPDCYKVPGAAVFWGTKASEIHHVAYLYKPVEANKPEGDWYLIEARGVMYGVVKTKLNSRKPDFWGLMTKYFSYDNASAPVVIAEKHLGDRLLKNGSEGNDVKELQTNLIRLGYDCGRWGVDGEFGDCTELAVKEFQKDNGLVVDGEFGPKSFAAMEKAIADLEKPVETPKMVEIVGGNCYVRTAPNTSTGKKLGVVKRGTKWKYQGQTNEYGWNLIDYNNQNGWVSGKYSKVIEG